ncbi:hypothetical protein [Xanthomonas albilineans]|nr:hypothetical protein [Xanthomonas albilineans]QHQ29713.1 hypothetical protein XaFJ1_GM003004 [Xanthomonas albilineans]
MHAVASVLHAPHRIGTTALLALCGSGVLAAHAQPALALSMPR